MLKGFASEIFDTQTIFRKLLTAVAYPGTLMDIGMDMICPDPIHPASGAVLLTLLDFETPFWSDIEPASAGVQWLRFHTNAPYMRLKNHSVFAFCSDSASLEDPSLFNTGTAGSPDMSTTLIVQTKGISVTGRIRLTGPGIKTQKFLQLKGITGEFIKHRSKLCLSYPLGVDMIFVHERTLVALPRTTQAEIH